MTNQEYHLNNDDLTLAATWNPRGELARFDRSLPLLKEIFSHIAISFPPAADVSLTELFTKGRFSADPRISSVINQDWSHGRYMALNLALDKSTGHIQYADMDRLLRWLEISPEELRETARAIKTFDCVILGRTERAYNTHPRALRETEVISNKVASYFLGREMDLSAGSKTFSHRAARFIIDHCSRGYALGTDSEWPIILSRAGFGIEYLTVDGLTWESADRYQDCPANAREQAQAAMAYDADPSNWIYRVGVAQEIVQSALLASNRDLY